MRTRRLLALTLRDLRSLARGRVFTDWEGRIDGRLSTMPEQATPLQRAQLLAGLSAGTELMRLRCSARQLGRSASLEPACAAIAKGKTGDAITHLAQLDAELAADGGSGTELQFILHVRSSILVLTQALTRHADYFDSGAGR